MMDVTQEIINELAEIIFDGVFYRENQEQAFEEPSFYVYEIMNDSKDDFMDHQRRKHLYCITWFPDSSIDDPGKKEQCEKMRSRLLDGFDFIRGLSVKVLDKEARIEGDVLNLTFKIHYRVKREELNLPKMEGFKQQGGLKDG